MNQKDFEELEKKGFISIDNPQWSCPTCGKKHREMVYLINYRGVKKIGCEQCLKKYGKWIKPNKELDRKIEEYLEKSKQIIDSAAFNGRISEKEAGILENLFAELDPKKDLRKLYKIKPTIDETCIYEALVFAKTKKDAINTFSNLGEEGTALEDLDKEIKNGDYEIELLQPNLEESKVLFFSQNET